VTVLSNANERTLGDHVRKIACSRGRRCAGDSGIFTGVKAALKPLRSFTQHAQQSLLLALVNLAAQTLEQPPLAVRGACPRSSLDLAPEITDAQFQRLVEWDRNQPGKTFSSPEAAVKYLKADLRKKR
jgi:hypothetical protein